MGPGQPARSRPSPAASNLILCTRSTSLPQGLSQGHLGRPPSGCLLATDGWWTREPQGSPSWRGCIPSSASHSAGLPGPLP